MNHTHHHAVKDPEAGTTAEYCAECERDSGSSYFVPGAVLVGAILISLSIFFSGKMVVGKLENSVAAAPSQPVALGQPQQAAPQQPTGPVNVAARSDQPTLGNKSAKVTIVEFADFQCPFCKKYFDETFAQIKSKYIETGKVKYVYRHYPLPFHVNAQVAAVAAECANQQGKFWEYHDVLFKNGQADGTGLDKASLEKYASDMGLNNGTLGFGKNKFNQCVDGNATLSIVQADNTEGSKDGVSGTPSFFINGQLLVGAQPYSAFEQAIEAALK